MSIDLDRSQGDAYQHTRYQYQDKDSNDYEESPHSVPSFISRSISSTASAIRGPCACRNSIGSSSTTCPAGPAAIWLKPGICASDADRRGAGGGAGVMVKTISALLVRACSAVN